MSQMGFYYDADNCIGCHTCQVACKDTNCLHVGENFRTVRTFCTGSGYTPRLYHLSLSCTNCEHAACMQACAFGAIVRNDEGIVVVDEGACAGCGLCADACPYDAIAMLAEGVAGMCDGCAELRAIGEEPACVASCPQRVIEFGPLDELAARHLGEELSLAAAPLPTPDTCAPRMLMRKKDCMADPDYDELVI